METRPHTKKFLKMGCSINVFGVLGNSIKELDMLRLKGKEIGIN